MYSILTIFSLTLHVTILCLNNVANVETIAQHKDNVPIITTNYGKVKGHIQTSFSNTKYYAYEGIPYGKSQRFELSTEPDTWDDIFNATKLYTCPQYMSNETNEDCLRINIYIPIRLFNSKTNADVIVYIHSGAFMTGSGHIQGGPSYIMDRSVIFVSFNYRLGILGFLSTQDKTIPGNNGLKDQVLALKWIQSNIKYFKGNPNSITLMGVSTGSICVHYHYLSKMSRKLFTRGFSQSGVTLNPFGLQKNPQEKALRLTKLLGCSMKIRTKYILKCLQNKNVLDILNLTSKFTEIELPISPFGPVIEQNEKDAFLSEHPYDILQCGDVYDVPWIVSNVKNECLGLAHTIQKDMGGLTNKTFIKYAHIILDYNYTVPQIEWDDKAKRIINFYTRDTEKDINYETFVKILTDRLHLQGTQVSIKLHANAVNSSVYFYMFGYQGEHSSSKHFLIKDNKGIGHMDDTQYFFTGIYDNLSKNDDKSMKNVFLDMLTSFAAGGIPKSNNLIWQPVKKDSDKIQYMSIEGPRNVTVEEIGELAPTNFWTELDLDDNF